MLARLGLRAGEVAALNVDDLDWRAGEIESPRPRRCSVMSVFVMVAQMP
ncbi:MAG TPA: hypothetical protein VFB84_10020 [Micromonosporaceae bacterium]|nr:hypothetical protein [Micromonosporaceae bacterium]